MTCIIGIDPDSEKHGVAVYRDGRLTELKTASRQQVVLLAVANRAVLHIENVMANQFVYSRNVKASKAAQSKVAMHIGRCQQALIELLRDLDSAGITYMLHKPQAGNWADNKIIFERVTGWTGKSNADTRSAAFFGVLGINNGVKHRL